MAFCGYCGAEMPDDMSYCTECGKPLTRGKKVIDSAYSDMVESQANQDNTNKTADEQPFYQENISKTDEEPSDVRWTMSEGMDLTGPENLYNSLKNTNDKKSKEEKKKVILPLVLTLVFAAVAITLVIIKFKPVDRFINPGNAVTDSETVEEEPEPVSNNLSQSQTSDSNTSSNASSNTSSHPASSSPQNESVKDPKVVGSGGCVQPVNQFSDYIYMDYYYDVYNHNDSLIVQSPKITTTLRSASGAIIATDSAEARLIMPGDTVRMFGVIQLLKSEVESYESEEYLLEWWKISTESGFGNPVRSDEFVFSNVSARGASYSGVVTGELTNNSAYDINLSEIYAIFYKNGEIVMISDGFSDSVPFGQTRVFEINTFETLPDYDTIECYINVW